MIQLFRRGLAARRVLAAALVAAALHGACAAAAPARPASACPAGLPADASCYDGKDEAGAPYWIAVPAHWNRVLVMHAHGGPDIEAPSLKRATEDLQRWSIWVKAGYVLATSAYSRGGYGVTDAAADVERLRQLFMRDFAPTVGEPRRTILHGQSYGGGVAAKGAELYGPVPGQRPAYDGVLLTSGVLGGGGNAYPFRLDLRVVYEYLCGNHPRSDEPQYPLWMGLPADSAMKPPELAARVKDCTGVGLPAAQRTPEQQQRLQTLLQVTQVPERTLVSHLAWATFLFRDMTQLRLGSRNPFDNTATRYSGSGDDAALNAGVLRYRADPQAVQALADDSKPTGRLRLPVLTLHAIHDPTAAVGLEAVYRDIVEKAGASQWLVQTFSDHRDHSYLSDPEYPAVMDALLAWIDRNEKPTPQAVADRCSKLEATYGAGCKFAPGFFPAPAH